MKALRSIFFASFLFFAHIALVIYINSTVLTQYAAPRIVSIVYMLSAAGSVVLLFLLPHIVVRIGLVRTTLTILALLATTLCVLGLATGAVTVLLTFVLYSAVSTTIWYCNDMFVAHYAQERSMGHTRGAYLTVNNTAIAIMPVIAGVLIEVVGFNSVYLIAAILVNIAGISIANSQRHFTDKPYNTSNTKVAWKRTVTIPALRRVMSLNFLLQFFYAVMVIYSPLYLTTVLHVSWEHIGVIFTIMLFAFVIMQYPVGKYSDRIGQRTLFVVGCIIASISTAVFALLGHLPHSLILYTTVLFCTRIGISIVEVVSESYFFKQVNDTDEAIIGLYRMMYPLAYCLAPLVGWILLINGSYQSIFMTLALLLALGGVYSLRIKNIR